MKYLRYLPLVVLMMFGLSAACAQNSDPLNPAPPPPPVVKYPSIHIELYTSGFDAPGKQSGIGGGFSFWNDSVHFGMFGDYMYLATATRWGNSIFDDRRPDSGDVGLLQFGGIYVVNRMFSVQLGFSYGDASLAVKNPVARADGSIEQMFGFSLGANAHFWDRLELGLGTRWHHRKSGLLGDGAPSHDSKYPDAFGVELRLGFIVDNR
jgi:hypothetical protein